jgi:tripartite-type tricarboxylate transporter receptor subunit TctC
VSTRREFLRLGAAFAASVVTRLASAQKWPVRPIRAIVPASAGSSIDIIARVVAEPLAAALGQNIVVENRGGAGGTIGAAVVARAEPDGHTILIHSSAHSAAPAAYPNIPYHAGRDFAGVAVIGAVPNVTVISPAKGIRTLRELVEAAKKRQLTFASVGVGSATHWAVERLRLAAGFDAVHVPFRGGPEALIEVATGRVDFMNIGITSGFPFIRSGRLIPLAVSTQKRSSALPDVPTTIEAGYPDSYYTFWTGMLVPAKTPRRIVDWLHAETRKALQLPGVIGTFMPQGIEPMPLAPREFDALIAKEIDDNVALVKATGLKFN